MVDHLQSESTVLAAVTRLLAAGRSDRDVAQAMDSFVVATSSISLSNLDAWERKIRAALWMEERRPQRRGWQFWQKPTRFASWLDLCSGDGFKRERILRTLSDGAPNAFFCALALRRLNDWVPQVRAAAREHLRSIMEHSNPYHAADALWVTLAHCASWGRMEDSDRLVLGELLANSNLGAAFKSRIVSATAGPAAHVLSQAGRSPALDDALSEIARTAVQPSVRARAYRFLLEGRMYWVVGRQWVWTDVKWCKGRFEPVIGERALPDGGQFLAVLKTALVDKSPLVRRVAAEFLIKRLGTIGPDASTLAKDLAADPSGSVAERGRFALGMLGKNG